MKKYYIYCHTNKINGKKYIGITSVSPTKRWANGKGYRGMIFGRAIEKYGWDSFSHEILYTDLTEKEACDEEKRLIKKYNTCDKRFGYNQSPGGNVVSDAGRNALSKRMAGKKNPMFGKPKPENNLKSTRKPVLCVETGVVYESISEAGRITGINIGHIAQVCKGNRKSAGGFGWQYVTIIRRCFQ